MSEQNVIAFLNKVNTDTALQGKIQRLNSNRLADLINLAKSDGFSFTADEWYAVKATAFGEVSNEELDQVAGGAGAIPCNANPVALQCNDKPVGIRCDLKPVSILCNSFYSPQNMFNTFGK